MNIDSKIINRFNELIRRIEDLMQRRHITQGYEIKDPYDGFLGDQPRYIESTHTVDRQSAIQWKTNCLQIFAQAFGPENDYISEFKKNTDYISSEDNYENIRNALGILKAAKEDYENSYHTAVEEIKEPIINTFDIEDKTEHTINACNEEAERNTRIYLLIIFVFLLFISSLFFFLFGIKYASIFTLIILTTSYLISAFSLKEWTPTKLPERILEIEKERIYKRFGIDMN